MTSRNTETPEEIVAQLEPVLRQYAASSEANRRLAPEVMNALIDADVIRAFLPKAYTGREMSATDGLKLIQGLSRVDSAAGWISMICSGLGAISGIFPEAAATEMFADPRAVCAGAWFPPGSAEPVQGGYKISGRWSFGSGTNYATWITCQVLVTENGAPKIGENGMPTAMIAYFNAAEATVHDNWNTLGMRGTGSNDFEAHDVFVPDHRVWPIGAWEIKNPAFSNPIYRMGPWLIPPIQASVSLGIAQAAIDALLTLAGSKTPSYTQTSLADKATVQDRVARAQAIVEAAKSYLDSSVAEAEEALRTAPRLDMEIGLRVARAGSFGVEAAVQAVDMVHACAGTASIQSDQPFQHYFRDVHTLSQHAFASPSRFESIGKLMLGRETDWVFYYL